MLSYAESVTISLAETTASLWNHYLCPLCTASSVGNLVQLKILLEERRVNVNERSFDNESIIQLAARHGHEEVVNYLLSKHHDKFSDEDICKALVECLESEKSTPQCLHALRTHCEQHEIAHSVLMTTLCKKSSLESILPFYKMCVKKGTTLDVDNMLSATLNYSKDPQIVQWLLQECYADPKYCFADALKIASKASKFTKEEIDILLMLIQYGLPLERRVCVFNDHQFTFEAKRCSPTNHSGPLIWKSITTTRNYHWPYAHSNSCR